MDDVNSTFTFYGQEPVLRWYSSLHSDSEVCAVRFVDSERVDYEVRTFPDSESALNEGYIVTHRRHCGVCSSLRTLAVYLASPDLTTPSGTCVRRLTMSGVKKCFMEEVGLEEPCAEAWTYNVMHTRRHCFAICTKHYGLLNLVMNDMYDAHRDDSGNLNPCLACDEYRSGPGFRYAAGRTRRASGLTSAIPRPIDVVYSVDHSLYFK